MKSSVEEHEHQIKDQEQSTKDLVKKTTLSEDSLFIRA